MITVTFPNAQQLHAKIEAMPDRVHQSLLRKITSLALVMEGRVKDKLSGPVLKVRSGDLRRSIHHEIEDSANSIYGIVFSTGGRDNQPPYAAIHEFGGVIHHPGGTPFFVKRDGQAVFVSKAAAADMFAPLPVTRAHTINIPQRSYMRSTFNEMKQEISDGLRQAVSDGINGR